jgi:hypothetical protein
MKSENAEYKPPPDETIRDYARQVFDKLAERRNAPHLNSPTNVNGLSALIKIVMLIEAKRRNSHHQK